MLSLINKVFNFTKIFDENQPEDHLDEFEDHTVCSDLVQKKLGESKIDLDDIVNSNESGESKINLDDIVNSNELNESKIDSDGIGHSNELGEFYTNQPYLNKNVEFDPIFYYKLLKEFEHKDVHISQYSSYQPKAGDLFIVKNVSNNRRNVRDGYRYHENSRHKFMTTSLNGLNRTTYYIGHKSESNKIKYVSTFKKITYFIENSKKPLVLAHYIGDLENIQNYLNISHGNAKNDNSKRPFLSTDKIVRDKIKNEVKTEKKSTKKMYEKLKASIEKNKEVLDFETVRDEKQVQNFKNNEIKKLQISIDEINSVRYLKLIGLDFFIQDIIIGSQLDILLAHPGSIQLCERLIENEDKIKMFYIDMTYDITDYYVTIVTTRNEELKECPCFPVLYMVHQRKNKKTYNRLFNFFDELIGMNGQICFTSDREPGINSAYDEFCSKRGITNNMFYCEIHIKEDIKFWASKKIHQLNEKIEELKVNEQDSKVNDEIDSIKNEINQLTHFKTYSTRLVDSGSIEQLEEDYNQLKSNWSLTINNYFEKSIFSTIVHNIDLKEKHHNDEKVLNNISESMNSSLKRFIPSKKLRLDSAVLELFNHCSSFINEFNQAIENKGKYHLKSTNRQPKLKSYHYIDYQSELVKINQTVKLIKSELRVEQDPSLTKHQIAELIIKKDLIIHLKEFKCYTIKNPFNLEVNSVRTDTSPPICNCNFKNENCIHKIAVELHLNGSSELFEIDRNFSKIKKNTYSHVKSGKKGLSDRTRKIKVISNEIKKLGRPKGSTKVVKEVGVQIRPKIKLEKATKLISPLPYQNKESNATDNKKNSDKSPSDKIESFILKQTKSDLIELNYPDDKLTGDQIECFILKILKINGRKDILLIDSIQFLYSENACKYLVNYLNPQINSIFVVCNTHSGNGFHWVLGVIHVRLNKIIIYDSLNLIHYHPEIFKKLIIIVEYVNILKYGDISTERPSLIVAKNTPQQNSALNCGIFVSIFAQNLIFKNLTTEFASANHLRSFFMHVINSNINCYQPTSENFYSTDVPVNFLKNISEISDDEIERLQTSEDYSETFDYI